MCPSNMDDHVVGLIAKNCTSFLFSIFFIMMLLKKYKLCSALIFIRKYHETLIHGIYQIIALKINSLKCLLPCKCLQKCEYVLF